MRENLILCAFVYVLISIIPFAFGMGDANSILRDNNCTRKMTRIEYLFPAHALGCWANERTE